MVEWLHKAQGVQGAGVLEPSLWKWHYYVRAVRCLGCRIITIGCEQELYQLGHTYMIALHDR